MSSVHVMGMSLPYLLILSYPIGLSFMVLFPQSSLCWVALSEELASMRYILSSDVSRSLKLVIV